MKAMVINQFGEVDVFQPAKVAAPDIFFNHVLIKVEATSVNPLDSKVRSGALSMLAPAFPAVLHGDVAGVVAEVGEGVTQFKTGDEVYGCAGGLTGMSGALAEYMLADADLLAHKPKSLTMAQAAALPLVSLTAWQALERLNILTQPNILIHAGTGGVGHIAIQLAKCYNTIVYTTVSTLEKMEIAKSLGADVTINYKEATVNDYVSRYTQGKGFAAVFDTLGEKTLDVSLEAAALNGQVATIVAATSHDLSAFFFKGLSLHAIMQPNPLLTGQGRKTYGEILKQISKLVDDKKITPLLDKQRFGFTEVASAHHYLEQGKAIGKVVLENDL